MRDLHARMLAALLAGDGLRGIAELAAEEAGGPVAIVLPGRGLADASSDDVALAELTGFAAERLSGGASKAPDSVELEHTVSAGDEAIGYVLALQASRNGLTINVDREEVLRTAALATLAEVAVTEARDEVADEVRGSLIEDLRAGRVDAAEATRRAARLGCDLSSGAVALVAEVNSARPRHAASLIAGEHEGALAEALSDRIYALLPAKGGPDAPERTQDAARALTSRLRSHGPAAFSSFCASPGELNRAIAEAELMLDVIATDGRMAELLADGLGDGVYRILFRALATDPDEVRHFYGDTVEPLVAHDRQYRTDLLGTVETYLANDCNMNATARAVYAHRHTVAHRLARVKELTGLDPALSEDRERLGLGIKAYRLLAPTLPR
jgi:PucR family transcriptional regulator, purine catabolism regulatory protein